MRRGLPSAAAMMCQVSSMCGLGTTAFTEKFKSTPGQTFVEYRNRLRIEQACRELRESKLNIAEIAWPPAGCP